jgi:2-C-methyl-D-erythritol 2,4-cyclodiphosphate synthase
MRFRVGIGYDIHRLAEGRKLILGGVEIAHPQGLLGHSDADAVIHALSDAILGALSCGDIGEHFPDTNPEYKDIDSSKLLEMVKEFLDDSGYKINNLDVIIIAQEPKLSPFKKQMREKLCAILGIRQDLLNIKAKTNEGLGELGRCEAIACYATVSLIKES